MDERLALMSELESESSSEKQKEQMKERTMALPLGNSTVTQLDFRRARKLAEQKADKKAAPSDEQSVENWDKISADPSAC